MRYSNDESCYNALLKLQEQASAKLKTLNNGTQTHSAWYVILNRITQGLVNLERKNMLEQNPAHRGGQAAFGDVVRSITWHSKNSKVAKVRREIYEKWVKVAEDSHYIEYTDPQAKRAWEE